MRVFWIIFGLSAQAVFGVTVCQLYLFLEGLGRHTSIFSPDTGLGMHWIWLDGLLAAQFAVIHSVLLLPDVRRRIERYVPAPQYGFFFCLVTCSSLLLAMNGWQSTDTLWQFTGPARSAVTIAFLLSWAALFYSLHLTGLGFQTGWTPWWAWVRGRKLPRRQFAPRGAYRLLRHPIYLSFLGLTWFTPVITLDRALLAAIWTTYIFIGSYLKDRRLQYYLGDVYRNYQANVPGYPFLWFGPLGKVPTPEPVLAEDNVDFLRRAA